MIASTIAAMAGAPVESPARLRWVVIPVIGVLLGAGFTPAMLASLGAWMTTLIVLPIFIIVAFFGAYVVYRVLGRYDHTTAYFSAAPGGLNDMMLMGGERGGSEPKIALAHASRILLVITFVVLFYTFFLGAGTDDANRPYTAFVDLKMSDYAVLGACAVAGAWLGPKLRLPAAPVFGPMVLSGAVHLAGLTEASPPTVLVLLAQWIIGTSVGCRFKGTSVREILTDLGLACVATTVMLVCALLAASLLLTLNGTDVAAGFLAFSPGGLFEMSLLALSMDVDGAYVATMHIARIAMIIAITPLVFAWIARR